MEKWIQAFAVLGCILVASKLASFIRLIFSLFVLPGKPLRTFGPKGSWALVTGASDGIGKEFAVQLARRGFNIILVSRTTLKLENLARAIESQYQNTTLIYAMDFAANLDSDYHRLQALIDGLDIAILINNVGQSHEIPVAFAETLPQEIKDIITVNCTGTLRVTQLVLPAMIARKRGLILTMGSFGGLLPTPYLATYSGSKAFLQQWSSALGAELTRFNISVELVQSYLVTSAMSKIRKPSATIPTPKLFVKSVLGRIGRSGGAQGWAYTCTPYWAHAGMQWVLSSFVGLTSWIVVRQNMGMHEAIRRRALKKREREALGGKKIS